MIYTYLWLLLIDSVRESPEKVMKERFLNGENWEWQSSQNNNLISERLNKFGWSKSIYFDQGTEKVVIAVRISPSIFKP